MDLVWPVLLAYLIGGIPFGLLIARTAGGIDIRDHGSGNIGATNVLRVCGWRCGLPAFLLDVLKGFAPVFWLAPLFVLPSSSGVVDTSFDALRQAAISGGIIENTTGARLALAQALTALAAVLGHTFPIYLKLKGGKGVATSAGAMLALMPLTMVITLSVFGVVLAVTRYVSVASTAGGITMVTLHHIFSPSPYATELPLTILAWVILLLLLLRHRTNYIRLYQGTENRLGKEKPEADDPEPSPPADA